MTFVSNGLTVFQQTFLPYMTFFLPIFAGKGWPPIPKFHRFYTFIFCARTFGLEKKKLTLARRRNFPVCLF